MHPWPSEARIFRWLAISKLRCAKALCRFLFYLNGRVSLLQRPTPVEAHEVPRGLEEDERPQLAAGDCQLHAGVGGLGVGGGVGVRIGLRIGSDVLGQSASKGVNCQDRLRGLLRAQWVTLKLAPIRLVFPPKIELLGKNLNRIERNRV